MGKWKVGSHLQCHRVVVIVVSEHVAGDLWNASKQVEQFDLEPL